MPALTANTTVLARAPAVFKAGRRASAVATKAPAASAARRASARSAAPALRVAASAARSARVVCAATAGKTTIVDAAIADPTFSVLVEAVVKAKLAEALSGPGPFTVFAPTNDAFIKALGALKLTKAQLLDLPTLASVLKFHVVSGKVMSTQLSNGLEAATLEGSKLKFDLTNGVKVNGANVIKADIVVDNGVIHVIDAVLLPPQKPADYLAAMPGVCAPTGLFDPLGFTEGQTIDEIKRLREAELVHGRVAMLAAVGFLVGESGFNPLFGGEITGLSINQFQQVPSPFWEIVTLAIGVAEAGRASKGWVEPGNGLFKLRSNYTPGDLAWDPLGLKPTSANELKEMSTKEINNGRLAMLAIAGMVMQEEICGKTIAEQMSN